jgi:hypothetical protein
MACAVSADLFVFGVIFEILVGFVDFVGNGLVVGLFNFVGHFFLVFGFVRFGAEKVFAEG